jgi:hypothetical protein
MANEAKGHRTRNTLRRVAHWFGWSTDYHVAATYTIDSHIGFRTISLTVKIRPWLHRDNYLELVDYIHSECEKRATRPTITSITKLGA